MVDLVQKRRFNPIMFFFFFVPPTKKKNQKEKSSSQKTIRAMLTLKL